MKNVNPLEGLWVDLLDLLGQHFIPVWLQWSSSPKLWGFNRIEEAWVGVGGPRINSLLYSVFWVLSKVANFCSYYLMNYFAFIGYKYICFQGISNERLRDEILCQLVNQTWRNELVANNERGWLLMANCLSVFPPSHHLYKFLLK